MPFLDRDIARHDPFTKVLFYSVLLHYAAFFILFGNPFLILNDAGNPLDRERSMEVRLLSDPKAEEPPEAVRIPFPKTADEAPAARPNLALSRDLSGDEEGADAPLIVPDGQSGGLPDLNTPTPAAVDSKRAVRKPPPNMTGPEDCMLKVVGMVCPSGSADCIQAYIEFCASLPK